MNGVIGFPHSTDGSCFRVPFGVWRFGVRPWRDISKARTECHFTPCMYETLSSPFLDPLLFRLSFHLVAVRCSPPISRHLQSCKSLLSELCQVTYKTGTAVPKAADVPKWVMPSEVYSARPSTVLAYKKAHQVGRFDPAAPEILEQKIAQMWKEIEERGSLNVPCSHDA